MTESEVKTYDINDELKLDVKIEDNPIKSGVDYEVDMYARLKDQSPPCIVDFKRAYVKEDASRTFLQWLFGEQPEQQDVEERIQEGIDEYIEEVDNNAEELIHAFHQNQEELNNLLPEEIKKEEEEDHNPIQEALRETLKDIDYRVSVFSYENEEEAEEHTNEEDDTRPELRRYFLDDPEGRGLELVPQKNLDYAPHDYDETARIDFNNVATGLQLMYKLQTGATVTGDPTIQFMKDTMDIVTEEDLENSEKRQIIKNKAEEMMDKLEQIEEEED